MRWTIWFDDGSHHEGVSEQDWNDAPSQGVLIVREYEPSRLYHMGLDYYWLEDGGIKSCNRADLDRYLVRPNGIRNVKLGRWASNHVWERVHNEAKAAEPCEDC